MPRSECFGKNSVIVSDPAHFQELKSRIKKDGNHSLHVVSDFDFTLTKAFKNGKKLSSAIAQIREGGYLTTDYAQRAVALYDKYHPIEKNPKIGMREKSRKMVEWWNKHLELLIECRMNRRVIADIIKKNKIVPREGLSEFLELLDHHKIPLVIFSASVGDIIQEYLKSQKKLYQNINIISNFFDFDKQGNVKGYKNRIIHTFNKNEFQIKKLPHYKKIAGRKNVLLLGDSLGDIGMTAGLKHQEIIKIGFLNGKKENTQKFKKEFDIAILEDSTMDYVNSLIRELTENKT